MLTYPMRTLKAPSGVTRMAGANAYAAKLATSPKITGRQVSTSKRSPGKYAHPTFTYTQ